MKLDQLPVEILTETFSYLGNDLVSIYKVNKTLQRVLLYDRLWKPLCDKLSHRIQFNDIPLSYREMVLTQQKINQHVEVLLDQLVAEENEETVQQIVEYGVHARDKLLQVMDQLKPGVIPSKQTYNIKHNYWANHILGMLRHQVAIKQLHEIAANPEKYDVCDFFTALDGFHETHVLNPTKHEIFREIELELEAEDVSGSVERRAAQLSRLLFCTPKSRTVTRGSRGFLSSVIDNHTPGNDMVNICIFAHIGKRYGLNVSPVLLRENNRHVDANFARVEDPSRQAGYFVINILNQMVLSPQSMAEMMANQQQIQLMATKPSLIQVAIANATCKQNRHDLISENAQSATTMSRFVSVLLFDDRAENRRFAKDRRFSPYDINAVAQLMNGRVGACYMPERLEPCTWQGQVVEGPSGCAEVVAGYEPRRDCYKLIDERGLTWYQSMDELKLKTRVLTPQRDLTMRDGANVFTRMIGQYFRGYAEDRFAFY